MKQRFGYLLKRAQHALRHSMDEALRDNGLTMAQYALLSALEAQPEASNADLARACFVAPQTMIEILRDLQKAGLIARHPHPQSRRIITTAFTLNGKSKLTEAHTAVDRVEARMQMGLTSEERRQLTVLLAKVCTNLTGEKEA